jgi:hypothetical protein
MASSSTPAQRPAESPPLHLWELKQPTCPGQSSGGIIIRVPQNQEHQNWRTYSNTAY